VNRYAGSNGFRENALPDNSAGGTAADMSHKRNFFQR